MDVDLHALHSSGCLKGKAKPLSIAAIFIHPPVSMETAMLSSSLSFSSSPSNN